MHGVQGTPLLAWLFVFFFGLSIVGVEVSPWIAAAAAYSIYAGAFLGEIWRGCLQAIPKTQWEAGASLGLGFGAQLRYIIVPQATRLAIPPTVGFLVQLIKNTSLAAVIGFVELTREGQLTTAVDLPTLHRLSHRGRALLRALLPADAGSADGSNGGFMALVELKDVVKRYGPNTVLNGVSLTVEKGEIIAIIGRSGSGKSTMLRCVNGLEPIQGGSVSLRGHDGERPRHRPAQAAPACRHRLPELQPLPPSQRREEHHAGAQGGEGHGAGRGAGARRSRCCARSGWPRRSTPSPTSSRAASSSAWRSPARSPCSRP